MKGLTVQNTVETKFSVMSHPVKALGLKGMTAGIVKLPPAPGSTPIYRLCEKMKRRAPALDGIDFTT